VRYCACTHKQVDAYNKGIEQNLRKEGAPERTYSAADSGESTYLFDCPLLPVVTFVVGMIIMLVVNLDPLNHLVNGTTGVVTAVDDDSITVVLNNGRGSQTFQRYTLEIVDWVGNQVLASRTQLPFIPANGLTAHKQQGSTVRERTRMDMTGMGRPGPTKTAAGQAVRRGWTDTDRRAFLYVACTRPVCEDLLLLRLTSGQSDASKLRGIFESGLAETRGFVDILRERNIL
jgi:hypothetical protein